MIFFYHRESSLYTPVQYDMRSTTPRFDHIITHVPLIWRDGDHVCESPLGDSVLKMNIHNPFMHYVTSQYIQYIPRNIHTVFALLCFVVVIHWLIFPYPSGLLHWHCGNLTIAPVPAKQPWWIWINTSCEFIMNDCITTTKQSTTKPCAYFLGYTVFVSRDVIVCALTIVAVQQQHRQIAPCRIS